MYSGLSKCINMLWIMEARFIIIHRVIWFSRRLDYTVCSMCHRLELAVFMISSPKNRYRNDYVYICVCVSVCLFIVSSFVCWICPETVTQQKQWPCRRPGTTCHMIRKCSKSERYIKKDIRTSSVGLPLAQLGHSEHQNNDSNEL